MSESFIQDQLIVAEMMTHPALFMHPNPQKIAIFGDTHGHLVTEVLKHTSITEVCLFTVDKINFPLNDKRIHILEHKNWHNLFDSAYFDIIIQNSKINFSETNYKDYFKLLTPQGIFIQACESHFQATILKSTCIELKNAGAHNLQILNFIGQAALMAFKQFGIHRIREKDIFNKNFSTHYYNLDVHKAAFALPEFIRVDLQELI